jgi:hypothetical protein
MVQQLVKQKGGSIDSGKGSPMMRDHVVESGGEYTYIVPGELAENTLLPRSIASLPFLLCPILVARNLFPGMFKTSALLCM